MKYEIILDENNYVSSIVHNSDERDYYDDEFIFNTFYKDGHKINFYHLVNGEYIFDEDKEQKEIIKEQVKEEIAKLKQELSSTDYQIIKCSEYQLLGFVAPYDIFTLHTNRQVLRDKINELEAKI